MIAQQLIVVILLSCCIFFVTTQEPDFPEIPEVYSMIMETNDDRHNSTFTIAEYWDYPNNRARIDFHSHDEVIREIFLVDKVFEAEKTFLTLKGTFYDIDWRHHTCRERPLSESRFARMEIMDGHLRHSDFIFSLAENATLEYQGVETARNIICDHWHAYKNITTSNGTFIVLTQYSFSVPEWKARESHLSRVPVRYEKLFLKSIHPSRAEVTADFLPNDAEEPIKEVIKNSYEFVHFIAGPSPYPHTFQEPPFCHPRDEPYYPDKPLPPIPDQFQVVIAYTNSLRRETFFMKEYYDRPNDRYRQDYHSFGRLLESYHDLKLVSQKDDYCLVIMLGIYLHG